MQSQMKINRFDEQKRSSKNQNTICLKKHEKCKKKKVFISQKY